MGDPDTRIEVYRCADTDSSDFDKTKKRVFEHARDKGSSEKGSSTTILRNLFDKLSGPQIIKMCRTTDEKGNTALHCAAKAGNLEMCQFLFDKGADIVAIGQNAMTPLQFASRYGCEENAEGVWSCMEWLMDEYASANHKEFWQRLRTVMPGRRNESEVVFDICKKDKYGFSILHHAIQNTNWAENTLVVKNLFENGKFKITETDKQGNTSLHMAAQIDKMENHRIFDVFFEGLKSNEDLGNDNGIVHQVAQVVSDEYRANLKYCIKERNLHGKTPLHIACDVGNPDSVEQLISSMKELGVGRKKGEETIEDIINSADSNGHPPLHLAIESGNVQLMKILLAEGARVTEDTFNYAARYYLKSKEV